MKSNFRFIFQVWTAWILIFALIATGMAVGFASLATFIIYSLKGFAPLSQPEVREAIYTIWLFWLSVGYGIGVISALGMGLYFVFDRCIGGRTITLLNCKGEMVEGPRSKHYFKVWRKWFFAMIWLDAFEALILMGVHQLIFGGGLWMGWFQPLWMVPMMLVSGFFAMVLMLSRCKSLKVDVCV